MGNGIAGVVKGPYPQPVIPRRYLYTRKDLVPIIAIVIYDMVFTAAAAIWMYNTRDIIIDRSKKPINEQMDLLSPYSLKALVIDEVWEPAVDLHAAYEAMEEEEKRREAEK